MADNNLLNIGKVKSIIDKLFKSMYSILDGYSVKDGEVEAKQGQLTSHVEMEPNLVIDLTATNIGYVFRDIIKAINELSDLDFYTRNNKAKEIVEKLVGVELKTNDENQYVGNDISLETAKKNKSGMLGIDIDAFDLNSGNAAFQDWMGIAFNVLKYTLDCEADGFDHGKVADVSLQEAANWIFKYVDIIRGKSNNSKQLSHEEKGKISKNADLVGFSLVKPILIQIQSELRKLYQQRLNEELSLDKNIPQNEENVEDTSGENTEDTSGDVFENKEQESGGNVTTSKQIKIKLKKIEGSIDLIGLESNYEPAATLADIDDIVNQDEFIDALSDEVETYTIDVDEDGYDIEQCETCEIDPCQSLNSVMNTAIIMYRNLYILHWMAKGNDMMKLHLLTEELYSKLIQEIDTLGELLVEKCGTVQNLDFEWTPIAVRNYEFQESLFILKDFIQNYIDTIDYAYPNQASDVQSTLDEWLRYWNKQMNYFIKNQEEQ